MNLYKVVSLLLVLVGVTLPLYAASTVTCNDTDTVLMLHMNGTNGSTTFTDSSLSGHTQTVNGNAQLSTTTPKFGSASMILDGTGDYITSNHTADFNFGTGDFTEDFQVKFTSHAAQVYVISRDNGAVNNGLDLIYTTDNFLTVIINGSNIVVASFTPTNGTWYHIAITRSGTSVRLFVDGTQIGATGTNSTNINYTTPPSFGAFDFSGGLSPLNGYMDEVRIVKGTAVWTANFTAPSAEYANTCTAARRRITSTVMS